MYLIQMCSGITRGRGFNGELYAQRFHKLIYLHLFADCFIKISPRSSEQTQNKLYLYTAYLYIEPASRHSVAWESQ